jgi:ATP-binding protein involved in chromosome partitioning
MFFKRKKKKEMIDNTPLGSCEPTSCNSCSVNGCSSSQADPIPNAINDKPKQTNVIGHMVAIASGKGGVGKSTVTTNLAFALKEQGLKVGILDADIYGPSQAGMLGGQKEKPVAFDGMIRPMIKNGIKFISMANLTKDSAPTIWRAPIAIQAIEQFLHGVHWGELDYLLIDLPPGTGDIQLTLAQQAKLSGAIIVSTPQRVAAEVAHSGLKMFKQVNVPILGIVENMSTFACPKCHEESKLYKGNSLKQVAKSEQTEILASIPLDAAIMQASDEGKTVMETNPQSPSSKAFSMLSQNIMEICKLSGDNIQVNSFRLDPQGQLELVWHDGNHTHHNPYLLRSQCKCAMCVDELSGKQILNKDQIDQNIQITGIEPVGLYGLSLKFSDGHSSGIYSIDQFRQ